MNYIKNPTRNQLSREQLEAYLLIKQEYGSSAARLNSAILEDYKMRLQETQNQIAVKKSSTSTNEELDSQTVKSNSQLFQPEENLSKALINKTEQSISPPEIFPQQQSNLKSDKSKYNSLVTSDFS